MKSHDLRKVKSQLSDKNDTLEALRNAKRDVEVRLQKQMNENVNLKANLDQFQRFREKYEALESELVMQESLNNKKMNDMQLELNRQIDEINITKESEMEVIKNKYAELFHEKAQELQTLRSDFEQNELKINQQSRTISDLEFREQELNNLLSKKQQCHHKEFEKTQKEYQSELDFMREISGHNVCF